MYLVAAHAGITLDTFEADMQEILLRCRDLACEESSARGVNKELHSCWRKVRSNMLPNCAILGCFAISGEFWQLSMDDVLHTEGTTSTT